MSRLVGTSYRAASSSTANVTIFNAANGVEVQARTNTGVVESPSSIMDGESLYYWIGVIEADAIAYRIVWGLGAVDDAEEIIFPPAEPPSSVGTGGQGLGFTPDDLEKQILARGAEHFFVFLPGAQEGDTISYVGGRAQWVSP